MKERRYLKCLGGKDKETERRKKKKKNRLGGKMSRWRYRVGNGQKEINKIKREGEKKKQTYG